MTATPLRPAPRHRLRTRLMVALIALAVGVLFVTAGVTAVVARANARTTAIDDLRHKVDTLQTTIAGLLDNAAERRDANTTTSTTSTTTVPPGETRAERRRRLRAQATTSTTTLTPSEAEQRRNDVRTLLGLFETLPAYDSGVVVISEDGEVQALGERFPAVQQRLAAENYPNSFGLPPETVIDELDTTALRNGEQQSGAVDNVAFVAQPVRTEVYGEVVLVVTQTYETRLFGNNGRVFLLIAGLAILAAVGIAYLLARRLTRPIARIQGTADRIAAGDLSARVEIPGRTDDELAALARTLNAMTEQLGAAKNLERSFLLSISHDLRTPLTSIGGYAEAIADGTITAGDDQVRAARIIRAEARRLERLVADLLDLARLDAHEFTTTPRPVNAALVVRDTVDAFEPQARELGLTVACTVPAEFRMDVDPERLAQIVANLVENALKYAAATVQVTLSTDPAGGDRVLLAVVDDGPGIAADDLPHVFDRLYTSRTSPGRKVGTGLGLAIVRDLSRALGGTVHVESGPGASGTTGSRFVVTLPNFWSRS